MTGDNVQADARPSHLAAVLQLEVAVEQLLAPTVEQIDRSRPEVDPAVAEVITQAAADHAARCTRLLDRGVEAWDDGDEVTARRTAEQLLAAEVAFRRQRRGRTRTDVVIPSLLTRLRAAVESTQGHGSRGGGVHRSPIGLAAAELLGEIERTVGHGAVLGARVRDWAAAQHDVDTADLVASAALATRWVSEARAVVEPARGFELAGACPVCGSRYVWVPTDDGSRVRKAALQVTFATRSARCIAPACSGRWSFEYLDHLARVVVQDRHDRRTG